MNKYEISKDIIIPILASIIGGIFTFIGVYITIKHEKNKEKEEQILFNKPLFCRLDYRQEYDAKKAVDFVLGVGNFDEKAGQIFGVIKNTDNAILIIDGVTVNGKKYKSLYGDVVDKNQIFNLYVNVSEKLKEDDEVIFIVKDIMENAYKYKVNIEYKDEENCEMIEFKEIKK